MFVFGQCSRRRREYIPVGLRIHIPVHHTSLALPLTLARAHGVELSDSRVMEILGKDLELNTQGLVAWVDRAVKRA